MAKSVLPSLRRSGVMVVPTMSSAPPAWSISDTSPDLYYTRPNYSSSGIGTWTKTAGELNAIGASSGGSVPVDDSGAPQFSGSSDFLYADSFATNWYNTGEHSMFARVTCVGLLSTLPAYSAHLIIGDGGQYFGIFVRKTAGTVGVDATYTIVYFEYDNGAYGTPIRLAASSVPVIDVNGNGTFNVQAKKVGTKIYIRINANPWEVGDDCGVMNGTALTQTCRIGGAAYAQNWRGTIHAVATWKRAITNDESDQLAAVTV